MEEFSQTEADRHNALTARGWAIANKHIITAGHIPSGPPGWYSRWQLGRAVSYFERALKINPDGWSSMWALGKIYQRLAQHDKAFDWFAQAHRLNPGQPDVAREAGLEALDLGRTEEALVLCHAAVASSPNDPGLVCNLALAYCLAGHDEDAMRYAAEAAGRDPSDRISAEMLLLIRSIAAGTQPRPKRLCDAFPYG